MVKLLQALTVRQVARVENGGTSRIVPPLFGLQVPLFAALLAVILAFLPYGSRRAAGQFTSGVSLVEVYATVTDEAGRPLTGLRAEDFTVEEDGVPQKIAAFASGEFPLAVAVGIDRSFSMTPAALSAAVSGARAFIDGLSPPDQLMLIGIGSETEVLVPLETGRASARAALDRIERWGTTPLFDAVVNAIDVVQPAPGRRALILLSDGVDRYSRTSPSDVVEHARQHDVLVYPISIGGTRPPVWAEVAAVSGGRSFFVRDLRALTPTLRTIADELRHQYLLGYPPPAEGRTDWRTIRVRVNRPGARVRARDGYRAPAR